MTTDADIRAQVQAVKAACLAGLYACPPAHQGGYSVAWMRRALLGRVDLSNVRSGRLRAIMGEVGFAPEHSESTTFRLAGQETGQVGQAKGRKQGRKKDAF